MESVEVLTVKRVEEQVALIERWYRSANGEVFVERSIPGRLWKLEKAPFWPFVQMQDPPWAKDIKE